MGPLEVETSTFPAVPGQDPDTGQLMLDQLDKEARAHGEAGGSSAARRRSVEERAPQPRQPLVMPHGWLKRLGSVVLVAALVAGASFAAGWWLPVHAPQPAAQQVSSHLSLACPSVANVSGQLTGAASESVSWQLAGGAPTSLDGPVFQQGVSAPSVLSGDGSLAGLVQYTKAGATAAVACAQPLASGYLQTNTANAKLQLTNIDDVDAIITIVLLGPNGTLSAPGLVDLRVAAGQTTDIDLHQYAPGVVPLTISWTSTIGRVVGWVLTDSSSGFDLAAPTKADTNVVVPAVPADAMVTLLLTDPAGSRAKATIEALTDKGAVPVVGGEQVPVEAFSTLAVDLTQSLQGQTVALLVHSDRPVAVTAVTVSGQDTASVPGVAVSQLVRPDLLGVIPAAAQLVVSNSSAKAGAVVTIKTMVASGDENTQTVSVPAGSTVVVDLPGGAQAVRLHGPAAVAAAVIIRPDGEASNGTSIVRVAPDPAWSGITPLWAEAQSN